MHQRMMLAASISALIIFSSLTSVAWAKQPTLTGSVTEKIACVGRAIDARESTIDGGVATHVAAVTSAYSARAAALHLAGQATTTKAFNSARKSAWNAFNTAIAAARAAIQSLKQTAWSQYRAAAASCKSGVGDGQVIFLDDFNRPDDPNVVGNGWLMDKVGSNTGEGISAGRFFTDSSDYGGSYIYRPDISPSSGIAIKTQFSSSELTTWFEIHSSVNGKGGSGYNIGGYGTSLDCLNGQLSIADESGQLASAPYSGCNNTDTFELEADITAAPQNWMDVYVWDVTTSDKPNSPTLSFHNSGKKFSPTTSGSDFIFAPRSNRVPNDSRLYGYLYEVDLL